jgi:hypothetical protein
MPFLPEGAWIPSFVSNIVILYICAFSFVRHYLQHLSSSYHCLAAMLLVGNFSPRQPAYWLGTGDHINMPENTPQSPSYRQATPFFRVSYCSIISCFFATLVQFV